MHWTGDYGRLVLWCELTLALLKLRETLHHNIVFKGGSSLPKPNLNSLNLHLPLGATRRCLRQDRDLLTLLQERIMISGVLNR